MAMPEATIHQEDRNLPVERVQIGVRMEKRMIKVLKGLAEYLDITLGDLLEGITLHAFESESPFNEETRRRIAQLKDVYGMDYGVEASHRFIEPAATNAKDANRWDGRKPMKESILIGRQEHIIEADAEEFRKEVAHSHHQPSTRLNFMTPDHHRVRNFAVTELPRSGGKPLSAQTISARISLPLAQVVAILEDLQRHLFFLVLNDAGEVSWAYPVTSEPTPHQLRFSSGERIYAAWAEDALATPFVQGHLRNEILSVEIETTCAHCNQPLHITLDNDLHWSLKEQDATPFVFMPDVDWSHFTSATIIDAYWRNSLFFWSEEHVRAFRAKQQHVDGLYLTLDQAAFVTKVAQARLFGFGSRRGV